MDQPRHSTQMSGVEDLEFGFARDLGWHVSMLLEGVECQQWREFRRGASAIYPRFAQDEKLLAFAPARDAPL